MAPQTASTCDCLYHSILQLEKHVLPASCAGQRFVLPLMNEREKVAYDNQPRQKDPTSRQNARADHRAQKKIPPKEVHTTRKDGRMARNMQFKVEPRQTDRETGRLAQRKSEGQQKNKDKHE